MKINVGLLLLSSLFFSPYSFANDAFSNIKCGADIASALIGKYIKNERVVNIEARHKDLDLKNLGGDEISDEIFSSYWMICGKELMLLEDKNLLIHDVLQVPDHAKNALEFAGKCKVNDTESPETFFAILNDEDGKKELSPSAAWIINEQKKKFEKVSTDGMKCPRDYAK